LKEVDAGGGVGETERHEGERMVGEENNVIWLDHDKNNAPL
jgi:hypothetical protein